MSLHHHPKKLATAVLATLSLLLTGCFITPGKFTSELVLMDRDRFSFTYEGEIFFLALSDLAALAGGSDEFEPIGCYDEETFEDRDCTEAEIEQQRADWEAGAQARAAEQAQQAEQMSAMMGGIDPSDPEATAKIAQMLERQEGWERVVDKGDGVFDVTYRIEGELSHDFMFPIIEDVPMTNPFVQMILRDGDIVRINAPGFGASGEGNPMSAMMGGMGGLGAMAAMGANAPEGEEMPNIPQMEGTFTIITNGRIRANNTDEGSVTTDRGEALVWEITPNTSSPPTALIDLSGS